MSITFEKAGKVLLIVGLLAVLAQGLWQLPDLRDRFFSGTDLELSLQAASTESLKVEADLARLSSRLAYLEWYLATPPQDRKLTWRWLRSFPPLECLRPFFPKYFWKTNVYLAQKTRVRVERKLKYLNAVLTTIDENLSGRPEQNNPAAAPDTAAVLRAKRQIAHVRKQWESQEIKINKLAGQLTFIDNNGYNH
jgi:hypothetical protein